MPDLTPEQPTPEQQAEAVRALVLAQGPLALDMWRLTLEQLDGFVAEAVRHGWHESYARQMVVAQYLTNLAAVRNS